MHLLLDVGVAVLYHISFVEKSELFLINKRGHIVFLSCAGSETGLAVCLLDYHLFHLLNLFINFDFFGEINKNF